MELTAHRYNDVWDFGVGVSSLFPGLQNEPQKHFSPLTTGQRVQRVVVGFESLDSGWSCQRQVFFSMQCPLKYEDLGYDA